MNWEYWTCRIEVDPHLDYSAKLNELGAAGWELVAIIPIQDLPHQFRAFLKRPAQKSN